MLQNTLSLLVPLLILQAMVGDARRMEISNHLNACLGLTGVGLAILKDPTLITLAWHVGTAALMFVAGYMLFLTRSMGGGDVKMLTALCLIFGPTQSLHVVVWMCLFGGVLTLTLLAFRRCPLPACWSPKEAIRRLHDPSEGVPYGIAIGAAALKVWWATPEAKTAFQSVLNFF
jgi:prepilin peptidase CpaA